MAGVCDLRNDVSKGSGAEEMLFSRSSICRESSCFVVDVSNGSDCCATGCAEGREGRAGGVGALVGVCGVDTGLELGRGGGGREDVGTAAGGGMTRTLPGRLATGGAGLKGADSCRQLCTSRRGAGRGRATGGSSAGLSGVVWEEMGLESGGEASKPPDLLRWIG